jgi:hypothetical protein
VAALFGRKLTQLAGNLAAQPGTLGLVGQRCKDLSRLVFVDHPAPPGGDGGRAQVRQIRKLRQVPLGGYAQIQRLGARRHATFSQARSALSGSSGGTGGPQGVQAGTCQAFSTVQQVMRAGDD